MTGPRVALVLEALWLNGAVNLTLGLAARWVPEGAVLVVRKRLPDGDGVPVPPGVRTAFLTAKGKQARFSLVPAVFRMAAIARRADVVVVSGEVGLAPIVGFAGARLARKPFVIGVHADLDEAIHEWVTPLLRPLLRFVHRHADGVIAVEGALRESVERNGLPGSRVRVVTNGIDVAAIRAKGAGPDPYAALPEKRVVLTGRLARQKGTDLLIRAHAEVVRRHPHVVLILNDGPDLDALRALTARLGVADTVRFEGRVPPHAAVRGADLFCLPSRHEGLPLALLEAMALGTPTLAADSSAGVRDALDGGRAGGLVATEDVEALAAALAAHLADPTALRAKAVLATERLPRFDEAAMADGWLRAAGELASGR